MEAAALVSTHAPICEPHTVCQFRFYRAGTVPRTGPIDALAACWTDDLNG